MSGAANFFQVKSLLRRQCIFFLVQFHWVRSRPSPPGTRAQHMESVYISLHEYRYGIYQKFSGCKSIPCILPMHIFSNANYQCLASQGNSHPRGRAIPGRVGGLPPGGGGGPYLPRRGSRPQLFCKKERTSWGASSGFQQWATTANAVCSFRNVFISTSMASRKSDL